MDEGFDQWPIDFATEDVVVKCLKRLRDIDEDAVRLRWRASAHMKIDERVRDLVGNNGPEYSTIIDMLAEMV